jgi:hypothetical protein
MSEPKQFRKKPVVIEAMGPLTAGNSAEIAEWCGGIESPEWGPTDRPGVYAGALSISTLEGPMRANLGDFIIRGVKGEFYPCKPDIFEATYEEVSA